MNSNSPNEIQALPDALLVPLDRIKPMKDQPRSEFDEAKDNELFHSIKSLHEKGKGIAGTGIIQAGLGRWPSGAFDQEGNLCEGVEIDLIAGERRFRAAQRLGLSHMPLTITDENSEDAYEIAMIENLIRGDKTPLDEARSFQYLMNKHKLSRRKLAQRLYGDMNKQGYIQNRLDLLRVPDEVKVLINQRADSVAMARRIATIPDSEKRQAVVELALSGANLKTVEEAISKAKGLKAKPLDEGRHSHFSKQEQEDFLRGKAFVPTISEVGEAQPSSKPLEPDDDYDALFGETSSLEDQTARLGSPRPRTMPLAPRIDTVEALDSISRQLDAVVDAIQGVQTGGELSPHLRASLKRSAHTLQLKLEGLEKTLNF